MSRKINRHNTGIAQHLLRQQPVIRPAAAFCSNTSIKIKFVCSDIEVDFEVAREWGVWLEIIANMMYSTLQFKRY